MKRFLLLASFALFMVAGMQAGDRMKTISSGVKIYYNIVSSEQRTVEITYGIINSLGEKHNYKGNIKIPATITEELVSGNIVYTVIGIGRDAFSYTEVESIDLSECQALKYISNNAFASCERLSNVNLSGCVALESIGESAFSSCPNVTSVNLDDCSNLKSIGAYAFSESGISNISLSDMSELTGIGQYAFAYCSSLQFASITNCPALTTIGNNAFAGSSLYALSLSGLSSLNTIGASAFAGCSSLMTLDMVNCSNSLSLGASAFSGCAALKTINCGCTVPPTFAGDPAFSASNYANVTVNIPTNSIDAYKNAPYWKNFYSIQNAGSFLLGDANGDGEISISDVVAISNHLLDVTLPIFDKNAADANCDGEVTISDVVVIVEIILGNQ